MEKMRAPSRGTLALLCSTPQRRPGRLFDDWSLDRENGARPIGTQELPKVDEIKLVLVQVRSQFGHRGQDEERDQREQTKGAIGFENER